MNELCAHKRGRKKKKKKRRNALAKAQYKWLNETSQQIGARVGVFFFFFLLSFGSRSKEIDE
jgi:hypothetical protein